MRLGGDPDALDHIANEIADVFIFLLRLCDVMKIDPEIAIQAKLVQNAERYPVATAKGNARKHP